MNDSELLVYKRASRHKKKKRRLKRKFKLFLLLVMAIILLTIIVISVIKLISWSSDNKKTEQVINEINKDATVEEVLDSDNTELINEPEEKESDYWYYVKLPLINVDFDNLIAKNNDTVGWINVKNTNINYPFVLTDNNDYYLNHSFDKSYNKAGWVFLDYRNNKELSSKNNVLYAHGRDDKTMFGSLRNALNASWYKNKDNHIIRLSTVKENTLWRVFSVYKIKAENYYITTDFDNDEDYLTFLNTMIKRSVYNFNTTINETDKILTLSTCYRDDIRMVVQAKLIKKEIR